VLATDTNSLIQAAFTEHRSGRLMQCQELCRQILSKVPKHFDALLLSGIVAAKMGNRDLGMSRIGTASQVNPNSFVAKNWLAMLLRDSGRLAEASECAKQAVALCPNEPDAWFNLGVCYSYQSKFYDAVPSFKRAIELRPSQPEYRHALSQCLEAIGLGRDAIEALHAALEISERTDWLVQLANLQLAEGDSLTAVVVCERALVLDPSLAPAHLILSLALEDLGRHQGATDSFEQAITLHPTPSECYRIRGLRRQSAGKFEDANRDYTKSVELQPTQGFCYYGIVTSKRVSELDLPIIETMEGALRGGDLEPGELSYLHFALGKANDDLGDYAKAMEHFDQANRLLRATKLGNRPFDREGFTARIDGIIRAFSAEVLDSQNAIGSSSDLPILVVGMMRSGTTLLEKVLSCHPNIGAAGEQSYWMHNLPSMADFESGEINFTALADAGQRYCRLLESIAPGFERVVDKNPANFFALGAIRLALPNARIIHLRRNPIDTCLSIYMTPIKSPPEFGCDRENIVFAYRQYLRLMDHWRSILPADRFLEVDYEDLVRSNESTVKELIRFSGLPWNDECLRPEGNVRSVRTPSFWQVRQPLYTTSVERWKRYQTCLGAFGDLVP